MSVFLISFSSPGKFGLHSAACVFFARGSLRGGTIIPALFPSICRETHYEAERHFQGNGLNQTEAEGTSHAIIQMLVYRIHFLMVYRLISWIPFHVNVQA